MNDTFAKTPSFHDSQHVCFVGGEGIVRSHKLEAETWLYLVEMALGPMPKFGRVGGETMVLFYEADLCAA
ncbi:MAG: hypothetical protein WCD18_12345 [Thermosynechococcaceae cyanobacterium]